MKKYRVGIIGCGNIFPMHAVSLKNLKETELVAVCDIKEERAKEKANEFSCDYYQDYQEMIARGGLDVVHICTPHYLHALMTICAAEAGLHVLTEKPMSISKDEARKMIATCDENKVTLGVIFQNRYNPGSQLIKKTLTSGKLGKIYGVKMAVTWKRTDEYYSKSDWKGTWDKEGGGVVIDQAIHTMDLMRWFINSDIEYVEANIANRGHLLIDVEDLAEGVIKFKNNILGSFYTINYYSHDAPVSIEIHCERGLASITGDTGIIKFKNGREILAQRDPRESFDYGNSKSYWGVSHIKQITNYYESLSKGIAPEITGREAYKTQEMVGAIYQSGKTGERVIFAD